MPTRRTELQETVDDLQERVDSINDLADEALDPELSREELVSKVKEIAEIASGEEDAEEGQQPEGE